MHKSIVHRPGNFLWLPRSGESPFYSRTLPRSLGISNYTMFMEITQGGWKTELDIDRTPILV